MADRVSMSLDEIIKKGKKERLKKQLLGKKGKRVKGFPTRPNRGTPQFQGRVSRNFTFKTSGKLGKVTNQFVTSNRGNDRYFNKSQPMIKTRLLGKQRFNRINTQTNMKVRQSRQRLNFQRPNQQFQMNFDYHAPGPSRQQPRFIPGRNQRGRRTWTYNVGNPNLITPGRFANRKANLQLAKQRVQRARALIAGRIARNAGSPGQRRRNGRIHIQGAGRIVAGRFGLMTTRKANLGLHRAAIQQKILRAQLTRGQRVSPNPQMFRGQGGRQVNLDAMSQDPRAFYHSRRGRSGRGRYNNPRGNETWSQSQAYSRSPEKRQAGYSRGRGFVDQTDEEDEWNMPFPTRRIQNSSPQRLINEVDFNRGRGVSGNPRHTAVLDPKIQSHISYIQEQGRRLRGEDQYDPEPPATPTVSVSYSSMTLSDRFQRFMN